MIEDLLESVPHSQEKENPNIIEDITDRYTPTAPAPTEKKDHILRNGKKYYKTAKPYVYKGEDGYYIYRIAHKPTKTVSWITKDTETGEKFTTEKQAYTAQQTHIHRLNESIAYKHRKLTFEQVWNSFLENNSKNEQTIRKYQSIYTHHVQAVFGNMPINEISVGELNAFLEKLYTVGDGKGKGLHGYSYSFTESILKFFYLLFSYAYNNTFLSVDNYQRITNGIKMPVKKKQKDKVDIRILTKDQIKQIDKLLKGTDLYLPFLVSLLCGTRPAETFALCFKDFDYDKKTVNIDKQIVDSNGKLILKEPKTFARVIEIPDILISAVKEREKLLEEKRKANPLLFAQNRGKVVYGFNYIEEVFDMPDFICTDLTGKYVNYTAFQYYAKIIRKDICPFDYKLEDFSFYTFRKTHLSNMAGNNCPVGELMHRAGHTKMETLYNYYYNRTATSKEKCISAVNNTAKILI